jgi:hypothetical protein
MFKGATYFPGILSIQDLQSLDKQISFAKQAKYDMQQWPVEVERDCITLLLGCPSRAFNVHQLTVDDHTHCIIYTGDMGRRCKYSRQATRSPQPEGTMAFHTGYPSLQLEVKGVRVRVCQTVCPYTD